MVLRTSRTSVCTLNRIPNEIRHWITGGGSGWASYPKINFQWERKKKKKQSRKVAKSFEGRKSILESFSWICVDLGYVY